MEQKIQKMKEEEAKAKKSGLSEEEIAFYDALIDHKGVKEVMDDKQLRTIARELVDSIRKSVTIDWTLRDNVQAEMRVKVKRILRKYGYPPDKQQSATELVLEQAKLSCKNWAESG